MTSFTLTAKQLSGRILSSSRLLRGVVWFKSDVLVIHIDPIFKGQAVQGEGRLDPCRWDR
jgi:hypothetical protein